MTWIMWYMAESSESEQSNTLKKKHKCSSDPEIIEDVTQDDN